MKCGAEDFGLLFMCPCTWFWVFGPSFPKFSQYPSTCETGITHPTEGLDTRVRSHLLFMCPCMCFKIFRASFPKLPQYLSTCEIVMAWPTAGPDTRTRSQLMWNKELKTLGYFSCVPAHDLGYSGLVSPNCSNTWVPVKQV